MHTGLLALGRSWWSAVCSVRVVGRTRGAQARRPGSAWDEAGLQQRAREIVAAERERLEVEALDTMRVSVARMRTLAAGLRGEVDVDALRAIHAHAHRTIMELRSLLVMLRTPAGARAVPVVDEYERALQAQVEAALVAARHVLARELHDAVSRTVASAALQADAAVALASTDPARARVAARQVADAIDRAQAELGRLRSVLRNDEPGAAIPTSWARMLADARAAGLCVDAEVDVELTDTRSTDVQVAAVAYQVVAEALVNASKYAPRARVSVRLERRPDAVVVSVVDRGGGPAEDGRVLGTGFGLLAQSERVERLGGRMTASATADGFAVRATIPVATTAVGAQVGR